MLYPVWGDTHLERPMVGIRLLVVPFTEVIYRWLSNGHLRNNMTMFNRDYDVQGWRCCWWIRESRFIKTFGSLRVWRMGLGWTKCPSKKLTGCNGSSQPHCHHRQKEWHCIGSHQRQPQVSKMWVSCLFWSCHWWFQKNHWEPALVN